MAMPRHLGLGLTALLVVVALVWGFMPGPVAVDISAAQRAALRVTVAEEGRTRVIDRYVVSAPVAGYLQRSDWRVGDAVEQGQPLLRLEPLPAPVLDSRSRAAAETRVAAAQASLQLAEQNSRAAATDAELSNKEFARREALAAAARISREERDRAQAAMQRAEAARRSALFAVDVARHELAAARTALEYSAARASGASAEQVVVPAPVSGRVLAIVQQSEAVVSPGQPLLELGDPAALEVEIEVLSADAVRIAADMPVEFTRWGGSEVLTGRVRVVEPTGFTKISALGVEEQRVRVIADITAPPASWTRLGDGYRVEADFILWHSDDVLQIPASALFRHADGWAVFRYTAGRARLQPVEVGHNNGFAAEIVAGLQAGDEVIVHPSDAVGDGVRVTPR